MAIDKTNNITAIANNVVIKCTDFLDALTLLNEYKGDMISIESDFTEYPDIFVGALAHVDGDLLNKLLPTVVSGIVSYLNSQIISDAGSDYNGDSWRKIVTKASIQKAISIS